MTRIFPTLASLSLMLYAAAMGVGLTIGNLYASPPAAGALEWKGRHMLTGLAAALAVVFVECIVVTYFIGTSRWCKEVTETYRLSVDDLTESQRLKRNAFPWCVLGMLAVIGVSALGAASDPGTGRANAASTANVHLAAAMAGIAVVAWSYWRLWLNIAANQEVIARIVAEVGRIRRELGLDGEMPAPDAGSLTSASPVEPKRGSPGASGRSF